MGEVVAAAPAEVVAPAAPAAVAPAAVPSEPKVEAEVVVEQRPEPEPTSGEPYELVANVPDKYIDEAATGYLDSFSSFAPALGIDAGTAQQMLDAFVESVVTMGEYTFDPTHGDHTDCEREIISQVGEEGARNVIARAQRYAASLGEGFKTWLDETNLGNEVSVIRVLALAETGLFKLSPAAAQAQLTKITSDPKGDYYSLDKQKRLPEVVRVQVLSRLAHGQEVNPFATAVQEKQETGGVQSTTAQEEQALRAEVTKLAKQKSLSEADRLRFAEITKRLSA